MSKLDKEIKNKIDRIIADMILKCKDLSENIETLSVFDFMNISREYIQDLYYDTASDIWGDCYEVDYPDMFDYMMDSYIKAMKECKKIIQDRKEVKE